MTQDEDFLAIGRLIEQCGERCRAWWAALPGESWKIALEGLYAYKSRASLSAIGVVIGTASIVLVVTVALTGKRYIIGQIEAVGSNMVYAEHVRAGPQSSTTTRVDELTLADLEAVRAAVPDIVRVAATRDIAVSVILPGGGERAVALVGVTEFFQQIRDLVILRGRYFDPDDLASRGKVCLLSEALAALMYPAEDPVGRIARIGGLPLTVIGTFRERVSTFGTSEIQRESVIVPFSLVKLYTGEEFVNVLYAQAATAEAVPDATRQIAELLHSRHRPEARYEVQNLTALLRTARQISLALTVTLTVVGLIALAISGIGIMNVMLVSVRERTREIGVRKAVGAPKREILHQFLIEAMVISTLGGLAGVLLAVGILVVTRPLLPGHLSVPISSLSVVLAFGVSCGTGTLFGYLPASRAAELEPVESLRYE